MYHKTMLANCLTCINEFVLHVISDLDIFQPFSVKRQLCLGPVGYFYCLAVVTDRIVFVGFSLLAR